MKILPGQITASELLESDFDLRWPVRIVAECGNLFFVDLF
jgi:hypothetical protein